MSDERRDVATAWDREYAAGWYVGDPPVPFVRDIIASATRAGVLHRPGVDIGCGNGRNYVALVDGGLDLSASTCPRRPFASWGPALPIARRVSSTATSPGSRPERPTGVVVGLQVFRHGDRAARHAHVVAAQSCSRRGA